MNSQNKSDLDFLSKPAVDVAPLLLGYVLERRIGDQLVRIKIVEVEAYDQTDAASHSYKGRTPRSDVMFGPAGHLYVYFTYGMHFCMNVVTGPVGEGSAVLIRAAEPLTGETIMQQNRHGRNGIELTNGPAKLCQALKIDSSWNGHDLQRGNLRLIAPAEKNQLRDIVQTTRIGISSAKETTWRFYLRDNPYVSKPAIS